LSLVTLDLDSAKAVCLNLFFTVCWTFTTTERWHRRRGSSHKIYWIQNRIQTTTTARIFRRSYWWGVVCDKID